MTTSEDVLNFTNSYDNLRILSYSYEENFEHYILQVLAAYKIDYKKFFSKLLFSIDPGTKQIGIVIFLDDFFLLSHTIYDKREFIKYVKDKVECFQKNNPNLIMLEFKFGSGVLQIIKELIEELYVTYKNRGNLDISLIDESKSSKMKNLTKKKRFKTKHETAALILALRNGIKINQNNYYEILKQHIFQKSKSFRKTGEDTEEFNDLKIKLRDIVDRLINDEISLTKSSQIIGQYKQNNLI
ncbi:MAG: hypothetical protein ACFE9I_04890 [Candidatus Hermodarchaeota archaeon]